MQNGVIVLALRLELIRERRPQYVLHLRLFL
jgi:hypothetical protein